MRWFKHLTASNRDEKLMRIVDEFGLEGYGLYWVILEIIGEKVDENSETSVTFSPKNWRKVTNFSPKKFHKYLEFSKKIGLFFSKIEDGLITIDCPNLLKYKDEYTKKKINKPPNCQDNVIKMSGACQVQDTETETDTDTDTDKKTKTKKVSIQKIVDLYHEILPQLPVVRSIHGFEKNLKARLEENQEYQNLSWWRCFFESDVKKSDFLMGKVNGFKCNLGWIAGKQNFSKILNGQYSNHITDHKSKLATLPDGTTVSAITLQNMEITKQMLERDGIK